MSEFRTPEPMSERRRTYMRLIAEVGVCIVGVVALALLGGPVVGILMPFILALSWRGCSTRSSRGFSATCG